MSRKQTRFFDDGDFTPDHDAIFGWVLAEPNAVAEAVAEAAWGLGARYADVVGEPVMEGYPPVFPDAFLEAVVMDDTSRCGVFHAVVEIKPTVGSVGRVMRQLRIYEARHRRVTATFDHGFYGNPSEPSPTYQRWEASRFGRRLIVVLLTTAKDHDKVFEDQGFVVVHPPKLDEKGSWEEE